MGQRPAYAVRLKSIETGNVIGLCAAWERENSEYLSGAIDRSIAEIHLKDGTILKPTQDDEGRDKWPVYLNFYDNRGNEPEQETAPQTPSSDVPF